MNMHGVAGLRRRWHALAVTLALIGMLASTAAIASYGISTSPGGRVAGAETTLALRPKPQPAEYRCITWIITYCEVKPPPIVIFGSIAQEMEHGRPILRRG